MCSSTCYCQENYSGCEQFIVNGWKVARQIPKQILHYDAWNDFINEKCSGIKSKENDSEEDTDYKDFEYEEEEEGEDDEKLEQDEEEQENKEEEEEEEEEEKLKDPVMQDEDYDVVKNQMTEGELKDEMPKHTVDTVKNQMTDGDFLLEDRVVSTTKTTNNTMNQ